MCVCLSVISVITVNLIKTKSKTVKEGASYNHNIANIECGNGRELKLNIINNY